MPEETVTSKNSTKVSFWNSIKTKLIATLIALVGIPLIIAVVVSVVNSRSAGIRTADEINDVQAHLVEQSVVSIIEKNMTALKAMASAASTQEYVSGNKSDEKNVLKQLEELDDMMADGNTTVITGGDGMQLLRAKGDLVDVSEREYFIQAMEGNANISNPNISKTTGSMIITFAVPVYNTVQDSVVGILQRNYDLSVMHDLLASEVTEEQQELVIVDTEGTVIAHSAREVDPDNIESQAENQFYTDSRGDKTSGKYEADFQGITWIISWNKVVETDWVIASCRVRSVALAHVTSTTIIMVVIGVVFFVIAALIAIFLGRSFNKPLVEIHTSMEELAQGRFRDIEGVIDRKDEFGAISREINSVIDKLDEIVINIKSSADSVTTSAQELADTTAQMTETADDISTAVQEIADGATQQADEVQDASENTGKISDNIKIVTDDATTLKEEAVRMDTHSQESADLMRKLRTITQEMSASIDDITEKINSTGKSVENISGKVESINAIASQTNLLALNASIEAARAGEAGKGFAVVAEEIGHLADDSSAAADEIKVEMDILLRESNAAVSQADHVRKDTEEQMTALTEAIDSIRELVKEIGSIAEGVDTIMEAAEICDNSKTVVVDAMGALSSISQENAAASEQTSASIAEFSATINTFSSTADSLKDIAQTLHDEMDFFQV